MSNPKNPFEYVGANDLPEGTILDYYIEDFNYSRFIQSKRNILLIGERGCGKSMTLLYNSWPLQQLKAARNDNTASLDLIGVYIPCNTPLTHKKEYQLLEEFPASVLSEHHLVLSIVYHLAKTLAEVPDIMAGADEEALRSRIEFIFETQLPDNVPFFQAIMQFMDKENLRTQRSVNDHGTAEIRYDQTFTFSSIVVPILNCTREIPRLKVSHFMLLVDDAHDLNNYQRRALSSWIAYREHSVFSFKVALANVAKSSLKTASGGSILEGHDYTRLDMVQPFHNETSDFGRLAKLLVKRRLENVEVPTEPDQFFPISDRLRKDLAEAERIVREEGTKKYGAHSDKVTDYVYKYKRAHYFRNRSPRANRPEYSGFDTLVFLSTGVIRNLLVPCYWMYDKMVSLASEATDVKALVHSIPPGVQNETILARSTALWDWLKNELDSNIEGCSREDAVHCYQLFDQLALHFRERLLNHQSEPRANSFTVSGQSPELKEKLGHLFSILREAQLLYIRIGVAKDKGKREPYYVPNRMLWPERGLDPHGQHARVSLSAAELWAAAKDNKPIRTSIDFEEDTNLVLSND